MIVPEQLSVGPRRYRTARGRCPRCDSRSVTHLVIGMPTSVDDMQWQQDWVVSVGCMYPGYDRECADCGLGWTSDAQGQRTTWTELTSAAARIEDDTIESRET